MFYALVYIGADMKNRFSRFFAFCMVAVMTACSSPENMGTVAHFKSDQLPCGDDTTGIECLHKTLATEEMPQRIYAVDRQGDSSLFLFWQDYVSASSAIRALALSGELDVYKVPAKTEAKASGEATTQDGIVSIVNVPSPWYAPEFVVNGRMQDAIPDYAVIPGLDFKYFTTSDQGTLGGIYLWQSKASAEAFYNDAWHARIQETYGQEADLKFYKLVAISRDSLEMAK